MNRDAHSTQQHSMWGGAAGALFAIGAIALVGCNKPKEEAATADAGTADAGSATAEPKTADATKPSGAAPADAAQPAPKLCKGQFALCNDAPCKKQGDGFLCSPCTVHEGQYNFGYSDCASRDAKLISTFSDVNTADKKNLLCPAGTPWADCLDAPCKDLGNGKAECSCPAGDPSGPSTTYGGNCDTKTCGKTIWSAFAQAKVAAFSKAYTTDLKAAGGTPLEAKMCSQ